MSNQFVIYGLKVKLSEIAASTRMTERRLKDLAAERAMVLGTLRLFEAPEDEKPTAGALGIKFGTFSRTILEVLRVAEASMSPRQIAEVLAERAGRPLEKRELEVLITRVRNALPKLSDQLEGEERGRTVFWRVRYLQERQSLGGDESR